MFSRRSFLSKIGVLCLWGITTELFKWFTPQEVRANALNTAEKYHQASKLTMFNILSGRVMQGHKPPSTKKYPDAEKIKLPQNFKYQGISVKEAIEKRRSTRNFTQHPISLKELSELLHYSTGTTQGNLRAAPSAGALYPIEIYPIIHRVEGIKQGIYHYSIEDHSLELLKEGDCRERISQYCLGQEFVGKCNVVFVLTAVFARTKWKYGDRAYRYVLLEAGHIGENIYLSAVSMGLGACAVGAFFDDSINKELNIDGIKEAVIHLTVAGKV